MRQSSLGVIQRVEARYRLAVEARFRLAQVGQVPFRYGSHGESQQNTLRLGMVGSGLAVEVCYV